MIEYNLPEEEYQKKKDIYDAITIARFSPNSVVEIIKSHDEMHFGTTNMTMPLIKTIFWAHTQNRPEKAQYIMEEFSHEIDFSELVYQSIVHDLDAIIVDDYFDRWKLKDDDRKKPVAVILQILKRSSEEYLDILLDNRDIINTLTQRNVQDMFHTFTSRLMRKPEVVAKWKVILSKFNNINDMMIIIAKDDDDLLVEYYPDATEMFLF